MAAGRSPGGGGDQARVTELSVRAFTTGALGACRGGLLGAKQRTGPCHKLGTPSPSPGSNTTVGKSSCDRTPSPPGEGGDGEHCPGGQNGHSLRGLPGQDHAAGPPPPPPPSQLVTVTLSTVEQVPGPQRPHLAQGHHELSTGPGKGLLPVLTLDPLCALESWAG